MGASFSTWARWDDTVVQRVLANSEVPATQNFGPGIIQGAHNLTIYGGTFIQNNQQGGSPQDPERFRKVLDFLSLVNFRSIQQTNLGKWTPGTVKWLLKSSMFQFWLETQCAILWGTGMPGAGKTILASVVIKHLQALAQASTDICVAFVYCRYTEPMKVRDILAALVRQLLERFPRLLSVAEPLYAQHDLEGTKPTQSELIDVICALCGCFRMAYIFIDGLDEALYDEQFDLLDTLKTVPANFFITSRPLVRLKDVLPNVEFFDIAAKNEDIELLVSQHIDRNPDLRLVLAAGEQRERVIKKICESSHGMFLHASLMVEAVSHCTSSRRVMEQLDKLPANLDILYDEAFKRIEEQPEEHAALAKRVLLWVVFAYQPLTVGDLQYAVASDPSVDWASPDDNLAPESLLISVCCGLIGVEPHLDLALPSNNLSNGIVRLVHYTAHDALRRLLDRQEVSPHCLLAEVCIERLTDCGIPNNQPDYHPCEPWDQTWLCPKPLLDYAYKSWHLHATESLQRPARSDAQPVASMLHFLEMCKRYPAFEDLPYGLSDFDNFTAPIHLVAYYHLPTLLPLIDPQVNELTKEGRTPLSLAAWRKDAAMVELLLKLDGIDVNHQDEDGNTALLVAAKKGSVDVVKTLLLDPRTNLHKRNKEGGSALHCALRGGSSSSHTATALHLIATGIDINSADDCGRTPLMLAYSHPVGLLDKLAQHPDIDFLKTDKDGLTPLMYACRWGRSLAVQWYLRLPGVDAKDHLGTSALVYRAQQWDFSYLATYEDLVSDFRALVDAGLEVNAKDFKGFTALTYAVQGSRTSIARALLELEGVDVNPEDGEGRTLLMVACDAVIDYGSPFEHPSQILDLLLQHPTLDVNATNRHGITSMAYAVARGVLGTAADLFFLASQSSNDLPAQPDGCQQEDCTFHDVPELSVSMQQEDPSNQRSETMLPIVVTGRQSPYPPGFRLPSRISIYLMGEEDYRHHLEHLEELGFGFPWEYGRISERHACCARLLLKHPDIDDHGFAFLRQLVGSEGNSPSWLPSFPSPSPSPPSDL
ncbi:ankyrin repeat-containing domain protein [Coprinopsis sp. MPI-PUGE-AT-0042]|nr:ankyrin repeat-containing domain protein [Coprinopsis sp. MPI-PUGE-AT-0042]